MFLPVYETWITEYEVDQQTGIGIFEIYQKGKDGFIVVHNGFGSFYAMFSCLITLLFLIGILFLPRENSLPIISVVFYSLNLISLGLGIFIKRLLGIPVNDVMLIGFYMMLLSQTSLLIISFYKLRKLNELDRFGNY